MNLWRRYRTAASGEDGPVEPNAPVLVVLVPPSLWWQPFLGTVFLLHAAVLGQAVGVVAGMRHAALRFTDYELNEPRPAVEDPPQER